MESILEKIIDSPKLRIYYNEIDNFLKKENKLRNTFYESINDDRRVEFLNGEIHYLNPQTLEGNIADKNLGLLTHTYVQIKKLGCVSSGRLLISLTRNDYEPDICFWNNDKSDNFEKDQMQFPAPDFIAEVVSPSTEHNDRIIKFEDYAAHGVKEYWIIDPDKKIIEQYILDKDKYELFLKSDNGLIKSKAIPGFEIPIESVFNEDENLKALKNWFIG